MTLTEARRHALHLCDVYPTTDDVDHIGVIDRVRNGKAFVSGHPGHPGQWFDIANLATSCKIDS